MRAENVIKYKDEIMSRPKTEWHKSFKEKKDLRKESKRDLKNVGSKFDESLGQMQMSKKQRMREKKLQEKQEERQQASIFGQDKEGGKKKK